MATKTISWSTGSGNITLTYQGQGNGPISVATDANNTGSARSQVIEVQTLNGAITREFTVNQAACPFPVGDVRNYSYTGSYQEVELPAGQYKFQVWGAQGGTCSAGYSGGKGGYSEGVITLASKTTVRVYVGGQGGSNYGGFNGGGDSTGSSSYNSGGVNGYTYMAGGGGATDIRLSDGALLSRMIVAGGGSGGVYCYAEITETEPVTVEDTITSFSGDGIAFNWSQGFYAIQGPRELDIIDVSDYSGVGEFEMVAQSGKYVSYVLLSEYPVPGSPVSIITAAADAYGTTTIDIPSNVPYIGVFMYEANMYDVIPESVTLRKTVYEPHTNTITDYFYGYAGGGTTGAGYSSDFYGKQNAAGYNASFGQGADQITSNKTFCSAGGGGGWYGGGGGTYNISSWGTIGQSGGGSGFVNTAASAGNRPSGYTGLQLDSGTLYAGNQSFPAPGGGNETGHSGNGYARITRIS